MTKVDSTTTRSYLRDGAYVTDPVLNDGAANYTPGISERRSSTTKFNHTDRLGTTERLTNTSQTTTDTRQYDAFGLLVGSSGSWNGSFGYGGPFGYQEDADSGLKLLGHRYYDPSTGRFLTRDRFKAGRNWYAYCGGNPHSRVDPSGLDWHPSPWQGDVRNRGPQPIIVIGEPGKGKAQEAIILNPAERDPNGFDADEIGIPDGKGGYNWFHLEITFPYTSSADVEVDSRGKPVVKNP